MPDHRSGAWRAPSPLDRDLGADRDLAHDPAHAAVAGAQAALRGAGTHEVRAVGPVYGQAAVDRAVAHLGLVARESQDAAAVAAPERPSVELVGDGEGAMRRRRGARADGDAQGADVLAV